MTNVGRVLRTRRAWWVQGHALRSLLLCLIAIAAYANSFSAGFAFDSRQLILQDPRVHAATAENVNLIAQHTYWWPYGESGLYRPATTASYLINYAVLGNGERAWGYHAFNVLLHLANVLLVWWLVARVSEDPDVALAAAAMWAVLPVSVEAVTNIVGRADLLAACGVLGGLLMYMRARDANGGARIGWLTGVAASTALAVFSKESGIVVAPLIVVYEIVWWRKHSTGMLAAGMAAVAAPLLVMWAQRTAVLGASLAAEFPFTDNPIAAAGFVTGRLTALAVMGRYAWLLAWPAKLSCDYSYAQIPLARGTAVDVAAWLTVAGVGVAAVVGSRRNRARLFVAALALVAFLPASNLLFAAGTIMAERLLYLPSVGIAAFVASAMFGSGVAQSHRRTAAGVATLAIVILLGARTWTRNRDWRDDLTLWRAAVADAPASAKAHRALAEAMYDADPSHANIEAVLTEAERSVALLDGLPDSLNSAAAYRQAAGYQLDRAHLLERRPAASGAADAARAYGRAVALIEHALSIIRAQSAAIPGASREPEADANRLLAAARLGLQQPREALDAAARARALGPLNPLAYRLSASAQLLAGHPDAAVVDLMVGSIVSGDSGLNDAIIGVYQAGLDEERCAAISQGGRLALNLGCAIVRRHTCEAIAAAIPVERQLGRNDAADRLTSTARTTMSCQP